MSADHETPDDEEILLAFSIEPDHGPATLQRYLGLYPHLAPDLLDLALELRLDPGTQALSETMSTEVESAWQAFLHQIEARVSDDEIAAVHGSLVSPAMRDIGLPLSILKAIRGGLVEEENFPSRWLSKIASVGGYGVETLRSYIARPPNLSGSMSFKSDGKPSAGTKVSFRDLVDSSTLSQTEKAEILRED